MKFELVQGIEVLKRTPAVLHAMLDGMSASWTQSNYGSETFSPFDVVGHLIHGEKTDWIPRARIILQHGEDRPFEPFDRYAMYEASKGKTMADLLNEFASLRIENINALMAMNLSTDQLALTGTHPELGAVTMENLLAMWTVHDLNHIHQIAKCMGHQLSGALGPWRPWTAFLPS